MRRVRAATAPAAGTRLRDRVLGEARLAARFSHPGAVVLHDVLVQDGRPMLVMELVDAPSLHELVEREGLLSTGLVARLGLGLLDTLDAAHRQGVVHLDVTLANVLVLAGGGRPVGAGRDLVLRGGRSAPVRPRRAAGDVGGGRGRPTASAAAGRTARSGPARRAAKRPALRPDTARLRQQLGPLADGDATGRWAAAPPAKEARAPAGATLRLPGEPPATTRQRPAQARWPGAPRARLARPGHCPAAAARSGRHAGPRPRTAAACGRHAPVAGAAPPRRPVAPGRQPGLATNSSCCSVSSPIRPSPLLSGSARTLRRGQRPRPRRRPDRPPRR